MSNQLKMTRTFERNQYVLEEYPPSDELLTEYQDKYSEAERFIPKSVQANQALIDLERLVKKAGVSVPS